MPLFEDHPLTELDRKAHDLLGDKVAIKSLAQQGAFQRLPRYVSEYLIAKHVKQDTWRDDLENVRAKISDLLPDLEHRELLKERLLARGEVTLIDQIEVRVDLRQGQRWARVPAINDSHVRTPAEQVEQHPGLLLGGLWGMAKIRYAPEVSSDAPNQMVSFTPFQVGPPDVAGFRAARARFTADEWAALMLQSAGYAADAFPDRRTRLLLFARMVPLVERNVNLIELGPRQTGKTFLLRNLSPRVFTISGGKTTPANLFVNLATKQVGILGARKVVVFDEVAHASFGEENETISTLKDYMESGQFSRGALAFAADAGLVFTGNLEEGERPHSFYRHLFEPLPAELIDSAFLDRIHGYVPGWEVPKITPASIATGVGFVTDYFGEVLVRLRDDSFADRARSVVLHAGMTHRDQTAVERLTSGMIKLLYPDGNLSERGLLELVTFACELRQRVHDQLCVLAPGEFKPRLIGPAALTAGAATDSKFRRIGRTTELLEEGTGPIGGWSAALPRDELRQTSSGHEPSFFESQMGHRAVRGAAASAATADETLREAVAELDAMIGLSGVKDEVKRLMSFLTIQKERQRHGLRVSSQSLHFVFTGNPGTGKTTVARVLGKVFYGFGILKTPKMVECDRSKLVGGFLGQTAIKTAEVIQSALDGVLFIDEAYTLAGDAEKFGHGDMYGEEAINTLLKQMEDERDRLIVIAAGYPALMTALLHSNPGLESRFTRFIHFEDYSVPELCRIFEALCKDSEYTLTAAARANAFILFTAAYHKRDERFGNARFVRNVYEQAVGLHSARLTSTAGALDKAALVTIDGSDIPLRMVPGLDAVDLSRSRWEADCPACGKSSKANFEYLGQRVVCACGQKFIFPWWSPVSASLKGLPAGFINGCGDEDRVGTAEPEAAG